MLAAATIISTFCYYFLCTLTCQLDLSFSFLLSFYNAYPFNTHTHTPTHTYLSDYLAICYFDMLRHVLPSVYICACACACVYVRWYLDFICDLYCGTCMQCLWQVALVACHLAFKVLVCAHKSQLHVASNNWVQGMRLACSSALKLFTYTYSHTQTFTHIYLNG